MKNLLFVCIENSNRSQMAQAFARIHGKKAVEAYSAGSKPSGKINPRAIKSMAEVGYDLSIHDSKSLQQVPEIKFDAVVSMGCGDQCPWVSTTHRFDWAIPDPRDMAPEEFNQVRDLIQNKVLELLNILNKV
jgi:arsenate reductase (thioredoxin)